MCISSRPSLGLFFWNNPNEKFTRNETPSGFKRSTFVSWKGPYWWLPHRRTRAALIGAKHQTRMGLLPKPRRCFGISAWSFKGLYLFICTFLNVLVPTWWKFGLTTVPYITLLWEMFSSIRVCEAPTWGSTLMRTLMFKEALCGFWLRTIL